MRYGTKAAVASPGETPSCHPRSLLESRLNFSSKPKNRISGKTETPPPDPAPAETPSPCGLALRPLCPCPTPFPPAPRGLSASVVCVESHGPRPPPPDAPRSAPRRHGLSTPSRPARPSQTARPSLSSRTRRPPDRPRGRRVRPGPPPGRSRAVRARPLAAEPRVSAPHGRWVLAPSRGRRLQTTAPIRSPARCCVEGFFSCAEQKPDEILLPVRLRLIFIFS